jgi:hypothetical protein
MIDDFGKLREKVYKKISRNIRNSEYENLQHLNCHTKQSATEGPDL